MYKSWPKPLTSSVYGKRTITELRRSLQQQQQAALRHVYREAVVRGVGARRGCQLERWEQRRAELGLCGDEGTLSLFADICCTERGSPAKEIGERTDNGRRPASKPAEFALSPSAAQSTVPRPKPTMGRHHVRGFGD